MNRTRTIVRLLAVVLLIPSAAANVIRVPQDVPTIQAGLDSIQDYDTVLVAPGLYAEAVSAPALHFTLKGEVVPDTGEYRARSSIPLPYPVPTRWAACGCLSIPGR